MEELYQIPFEKYSSRESMPASDQELVEIAIQATRQANAP